MIYKVVKLNDNILGSTNTVIDAKSPLEAVKTLFPNRTIKRVYDGWGNIVVYGYSNTRYGTYKSYVYDVT